MSDKFTCIILNGSILLIVNVFLFGPFLADAKVLLQKKTEFPYK